MSGTGAEPACLSQPSLGSGHPALGAGPGLAEREGSEVIFQPCGVRPSPGDTYFWWEPGYLVTHVTDAGFLPSLCSPAVEGPEPRTCPLGLLGPWTGTWRRQKPGTTGPPRKGRVEPQASLCSDFPSEFSKTCKLI